MHHINQNHDHGYKFKLNEVQGSKYEKVREAHMNRNCILIIASVDLSIFLQGEVCLLLRLPSVSDLTFIMT